jgi:class 3 adenylate cyclase/tetratricopeptide (TPR) repeat protein
VNIGLWLEGLGLRQYEAAFREHAIDGEVLAELTESDLERLGLPLGHRKKLLKAIAALKETVAAPARMERSTAPERRQLTVMFVDLVGSTTLSGRLDVEEMRDVIRAYQNAVADEVTRFEGHVAKFMGDGVLAYFGWPRAHEDEAERAVRAGPAVVEVVAKLMTPAKTPLAARVGVATGLVVVGDLIGEGAAQEEAVVGETPNLAARLQELAGAGGVVVAEVTRRLLGELFEVDDLGTHDLKGFTSPMPAWRVMGESRAESRFDALHGMRLSPLVGREQELALLIDRWRRAKAGEGQVVLLSGEPGIGKSRIAIALRERLRGEEFQMLGYHGSPYHSNSVLFPILDQLYRAAAIAHGDPAEVKLTKLEALLVSAMPDPTSAIPLVAEHLAIPTGDRYPPLELAPEQKKAKMFQALVAWLEKRAAKLPVLMTAEDVHWFDPTSLELFDLVVDRIQRLPALLVATFRPEFAPRWTGRPHVTLLTLNRLGRSDGVALIGHLVGGKALPAEVQAQILAKTEGVPLFVEELTKAVLESGLVSAAGHRFELTKPHHLLAIPATLQDSLMARLDRLGAVKEVAQIGAAIGREFTFELLAAVAEMDEPKLKAALDQLVRSELVFRQGIALEVAYVFKHALVQDAAYQSLLKSRRQQLHRQIAVALEKQFPKVAQSSPEILARHCAEAGLLESAIRHWLRAAQVASHRSANLETIAHCGKGLELIEQLPETPERHQQELELRVTLGPSVMALKGWGAPEVGEVYVRARELCAQIAESPQLIPVLYGLWSNRLFSGQLEPALELATELLALAQRQSDDGLLLQGHHVNWTTYYYLAELSSSLHHAKIGIGLYDFDKHRHHAFVYGGHDPGVCCRGWAAESLWFLGYPDQALAMARDAVSLGRRLAHPFSEMQALVYLGSAHRNRREIESMRQVAESVIQLCADHGFGPHNSSHARTLRGWALVRAGGAREGIEQIRRGIEERPTLRVDLLTLLADGCLCLGRSDEGLAAVAQALEITERGNERIWEPELLRLNGQLLLASPTTDPGDAQSCFERALATARTLQAKSPELRAATALARLWAERGERRKAYDLLAPIYGWFTEGFDTVDLKEAKALLEALA